MRVCPEGQKFTKETASEIGARGGKASGAARRKKKMLREAVQEVLNLNLKDGDGVDLVGITNLEQLRGANVTAQTALIMSMLSKALKGNVRAAEWIADAEGSKTINVEAQTDSDIHVIVDYGDQDLS